MINVLIDTRNGKMLVNQNDIGAGTNLIVYGEVHQIELNFLKQFCFEDATIFDCGANIGNHTLAFANSVGKGGAVYSFEPQMHAFQLLSANVALNDLFNVTTVNCAMGDVDKVILMPIANQKEKHNSGGVSLKELSLYTRHTLVQQKMLNEFININKCDLLKIDVEGYESKVLKGGEEFISTHRPVIYLENNREDQYKDLLDFFKKNNYVAYSHLPPSFNPDNFNRVPNNYFHGSYREPNIVALPIEKQQLMTDTSNVTELAFYVNN